VRKIITHAVLLEQIFDEKFLIAFFDDIPKTTFYCRFIVSFATRRFSSIGVAFI